MPLTFAHPAAVLPLRRSGLPFSALVVGSIAPDLEYLLRSAPRSEISHTAVGLLVFCVPVGVIGLWLYQQVWKRPMAALLGEQHADGRGHLAKAFPFTPLRRFATLCTAVLVGAMTHVFWDSFTHPHGWMVQRIPGLSRCVLETNWGAVPLYKVLQHGSTAVGLAVLACWALRDRAWLTHVSVAGWRILGMVCGTSAAGGLLIALLKTGWPSDFGAAQRLAGMSVIAVSAVIVSEVTLVCLVWRLRERKSEHPVAE